MGKFSGNSIVCTSEGLTRIEDLNLGKVSLYSVYKDGTVKTGFREYTLSECINQPCTVQLRRTLLKLVTTPDTKLILNPETGHQVTTGDAHGLKTAITSYPTSINKKPNWKLDLSLVSDRPEARELDLRDNMFNTLMLLTLQYGYATEDGISLPEQVEGEFFNFFEPYNLLRTGYYKSPKNTYFTVSKNDLSDYLQLIFELNKELPDEVTFNVSLDYYKYLLDAVVNIEEYFYIPERKPRALDNFWRSVNIVLLRHNHMLTGYARNYKDKVIDEEKYSLFVDTPQQMKSMYELTPVEPNTYLVSEGFLVK